jgi:hypothetical protein
MLKHLFTSNRRRRREPRPVRHQPDTMPRIRWNA